MNQKASIMLSRDGQTQGIIKNLHYRKCNVEGCLGHRILVEWPDGKRTCPCSRGCKTVNDEIMKIL